MARRLIAEVMECKLCGHHWLPHGGRRPIRCPNHDCRSKRWELGPITREERSERVRSLWRKRTAKERAAIGRKALNTRRAQMAAQSKQEALFA